jgi:membrane fusion protein (multidrug efflux system)
MKIWMQNHRRHLLVGVPLFCLLVIVIFYFFSGRYVSTDDAYVQAAKAAISSNVSGQVANIYVHDNQEVKQNTPLFSLDNRPYKIAVENSKAQLVSARLQVLALKATYKQRLANAQEAQHTFTYEQDEFNRQKKLAASGISSQMQLNKATNDLQNAAQRFNAVQQQAANALASLDNNPNIAIDEHPIVQQAKALLDRANLNLSYTVIMAPYDGIVTKVEQLQIGDYIKTGDPVFALISNKDIWVEANFKESQITYMRPGQDSEIDIDAYPNLKFDGKVTSTSPGTGSTFSLLPPENATGNWVKIVQRLPVRILINNPYHSLILGSGLSANVTVDTGRNRISRIFSSDKK